MSPQFMAKAKDTEIAKKDQWISFAEETQEEFKERIGKEENVENFDIVPI
jgi:hypothetical protein